MKKILVVIATTALLAACGDGKSDKDDSDSTLSTTLRANSLANEDSATRASDSVKLTGDTTALNGVRGDTTSASGNHGQGSGSRVGGGKTGGPQRKGK